MTFSQTLKSISSTSHIFCLQTAANISKLQGKSVSVPEAEEMHERLSIIFQTAMNDIDALKRDINSQTTHSNEEEMFGHVVKIIDFETKFLEELKAFNDTILTYCPTAKIAYGNPCIGPKISPKIDTEDPKILAMLANTSSIREIRGDGNCFLSAFTTRFLENLIEKQEIARFINSINEDNIKAPELEGELISTLLNLQENPSQLENILKDNHKVLPFINYFRKLAAAELKENSAKFKDFFLIAAEMEYGADTKGTSYESLIDQYVVKMGVDFSHPMIQALCKKLDFRVCIIDPQIGSLSGFIIDPIHLTSKVNLLEEQTYAGGIFCRKDNHYFVLYTREESDSILVTPPAQLQMNTPSLQPTEIIVPCKLPFGHDLFIRGNGSGLSWEKGIRLIPSDDDEAWFYFSKVPLQNGTEYKFLINDLIWQNENNYKIDDGKIGGTTPHFNIDTLEIFEDAPAPVRITTRITFKFHASGSDKLFIRGKGPDGLSWEKGVELRRIDDNTWVFETEENFENFEYKILLNDQGWEDNCSNHKADCGKNEEIVIRKFN